MKRTGKQIQFCCSGALPLSPVLVKVSVNYYISTAAVYCASCFFCFLETSRNRAAGWHSSRARAVHQCWERLLRQVCTASTDPQQSPPFRKWQCSVLIVSFRDLETVHHTGGGGISLWRQKVGSYTQQVGFSSVNCLSRMCVVTSCGHITPGIAQNLNVAIISVLLCK